MPQHPTIIDIAYADPAHALELGRDALAEPNRDPRSLAMAHRGLSVAHGLLGDYEEAIRQAGLAREAAVDAGAPDEEFLAVVTIAGPMTVVRTVEEARDLVESVAHLATTPYLAARLSYMRGVVSERMGDAVSARGHYETALPGLRDAGDAPIVRSALLNLGRLLIEAGELKGAEEALTEALAIATARGEEPAVSGLKHNLGRLAAYRGDLTEALALLLHSDEIYMRITGAKAPQHVARCEVLISAGLFGEASRLASAVADQNRAAGDFEHLANALLMAARAALAAGHLEEASDTAVEAARVYRERGRHGDALEARRIDLEARYRLDGASTELLEVASGIVSELESRRQRVAAAWARMLVGRIAADLGDIEKATEAWTPVSNVESGPIELRIHGHLARAWLRSLHGDRRGADAAARSGLRLIDEYQAILGATDLRMGVERHGAELGALGLRIAIDSGEPRRILRWMERTRARALRHRPVAPSEDEEIRGSLGLLRQVEERLRRAGPEGDVRLERERRRLQEAIRSADRLKRADVGVEAGFDVESLIESLGDRQLLEMGIDDGDLLGIVVGGGRVTKHRLGTAEAVMTELAQARFALRRAARRGRPISADALMGLDRLLLGGLGLDADALVVVPPPAMMSVPWAALPGLRGSVVTVAPSAEIWWRSQRRRPSPGRAVVVGGPDLDHAADEVDKIAGLYHDSIRLPPGSTVAEASAAIEAAAIAHVACHATFQVENPMFSSLRLGDGDLSVYDIERLDSVPSLVVLSACDSGYTEARSGDELAGLTSALLSMGTRSVVASVGLVPDAPATAELMADFHRGLLAGNDPASALSRAQAARAHDPDAFVAAASFVCVGA